MSNPSQKQNTGMRSWIKNDHFEDFFALLLQKDPPFEIQWVDLLKRILASDHSDDAQFDLKESCKFTFVRQWIWSWANTDFWPRDLGTACTSKEYRRILMRLQIPTLWVTFLSTAWPLIDLFELRACRAAPTSDTKTLHFETGTLTEARISLGEN